MKFEKLFWIGLSVMAIGIAIQVLGLIARLSTGAK